jgi:hypothetical protein
MSVLTQQQVEEQVHRQEHMLEMRVQSAEDALMEEQEKTAMVIARYRCGYGGVRVRVWEGGIW